MKEKGIMSAQITPINRLYYNNKSRDVNKERANKMRKTDVLGVGMQEFNLHQMSLYRSCRP